jgi:PhnB protein
MHVQPYLFFGGRCEEALAFYAEAIGATLRMSMRFRDAPDPVDIQPEMADKIMHASFSVGGSTLLASDGQGANGPNFQGFGLALYAADQAEAHKLFDALAAGGQVRMPLAPTFWSPAFGMVADKFGVAWMVMVDTQP